jgi:hypothetical protein
VSSTGVCEVNAINLYEISLEEMRKERSMPKRICTVLLFAAAFVFVALCSCGIEIAQATYSPSGPVPGTPTYSSPDGTSILLGNGVCDPGENGMCIENGFGITIEVLPDANGNWPLVHCNDGLCPNGLASCKEFRYRVSNNNTTAAYSGFFNIQMPMTCGVNANPMTTYMLDVSVGGGTAIPVIITDLTNPSTGEPDVYDPNLGGPQLVFYDTTLAKATGCLLATPSASNYLLEVPITVPLSYYNDISIWGAYGLCSGNVNLDTGTNCSSTTEIEYTSGATWVEPCAVASIMGPTCPGNVSATTSNNFQSQDGTRQVVVDYNSCSQLNVNQQVKDVYTPPGPPTAANSWVPLTVTNGTESVLMPMFICGPSPTNPTNPPTLDSNYCNQVTSFGSSSGLFVDLQIPVPGSNPQTYTYYSYFCIGEMCYVSPTAANNPQ